MRNLTIQELYKIAEDVCSFLIHTKGYDSSKVHWITAYDNRIVFELSYKDDFQNEAESSMRYHSGDYQTISLADDETLWAWAYTIPSRTQRETSFLIRQLKPIESAAEQVRDLEIQSIIQGILGSHVALQNLLEDARVQERVRAEADNPDLL